MLLDAQTFELVLTPEIALGAVQKELASAGHHNIDVQQIRLFYEPYWVFTFDVEGSAQPISGKTALNASTGDVNEFVPMLLDRPLNKTRNTSENVECEVEPTSVDRREVERVAQARVAAQLGVKKDQVSVSAFQKIYAPFYRIWLTAGNTPLKAEVDGCLGATFGLEGVPKRQKTMDDVTKETLEKMKSPAGWAELLGKTADAITGSLTGKGGPVPGMGKAGIWLILIVVIVGVFLIANPLASNTGISCGLDSGFLRTNLNLVVYKVQSIAPGFGANETLFVTGICNFTNKASTAQFACPQIYIRIDGKDDRIELPTATENETICALVPAGVTSALPLSKAFRIEWPDDGLSHTYELIQK